MKKKILGTILSLSMLSAMLVLPAKAENDFTVTGVTPSDGAKMVSAVDDVVITFSQEVDSDTLANGISVTGGDETYQIKKSKNKVTLIFDEQLSYLTEYTVSLNETVTDLSGTALTPYEFTFKTEYDPIKTLLYEDFEDGENSLAKFSIGGKTVTSDDDFYTIIQDPNNSANHVLQMTVPTDGWSSSYGYYPIIKGSSLWQWYTADYDLAFTSFDSSVALSKPKINWLIKGAGDGLLNDSTQRDILEHYAANQNYTQALSKRENAPSGNWEVYAHLNAAAMGKISAWNTFIDTQVVFSGSSSNSKVAYTYAGTTASTITSSGTETEYMYIAQGASGIFAGQGSALIDNLVVTDTGYCPTLTTSRKNLTDGIIVLNFPVGLQEISTGSAEDVKVTQNGVEVERTVTYSSTPPRNLTITIADPKPYTEYEITVPITSFKTGNTNAAVMQKLSNDKIFTVKTAYEDTAVTVTQTSPAINETDVSVNSDITISFSEAMNFDTITTDTVSITDAPAFTIEKLDDTTTKLVFSEKLDYGKKYTVNLSSQITSAAGDELTDYSFSFTTTESNFAILTTLPANDAEDVSVLSDLTVYFNNDVNPDTLSGNITVTPAADFKIKNSGSSIKLVFTDALSYYTDYTVTFNDSIQTVDGMPLSKKIISFKTAPDMGKALFYENFNGDAETAQSRFTETGTPDTDHDEHFYVEDGVLKLKTWHSGATGQSNKTEATIIGSNTWRNYEISYDFKLPVLTNTSLGPTNYLRIRDQKPTGTNRYVTVSTGDSSNNGTLTTSITREDSKNGTYGSTEGFNYNAANYYHAELYFTGSKSDAVLNYSLSGTAADGNPVTQNISYNAVANEQSGGYVDANGYVTFTALGGTQLIDNILVNDLDFYITAENIKNNKGTATLKFSQPLDTETVFDNIKVYDGNTEVDAFITVYNQTTITVSVKKPESGKTYRIKALTGLLSTSGVNLSNERYIDMSVQLDLTVSNLSIKANGNPITSLSGGSEIYGSADIEYVGTNNQNITLILAVYDSDGALYAVKTNKQAFTSETAASYETGKITLPSDITGYTASVFCWDDLLNIAPMSGSVTIPQ